MKKIDIIGSQIVKDELRYQHENPITTTDAEAKRLFDGGMLLGEPVDASAKDPPAPDVDNVFFDTVKAALGDADNG